MVAQNPGKRNRGPEHSLPDLHAEVDELQRWIHQAAEDGCAAHEVERTLFDKMLALGRILFQGFLQLIGSGDFGGEVTLDNGRVVHRSAEEHQRRLLTVFGEFMVSRWVYAQRDKMKFEFVPTDQRLQLPASEVSYLLQEWDQLLGIEHAFGKVREVIQTILRHNQSVDTLEHTNQQMAAAAPVFREEQGPVDLSQEGELLIVSEDNKGIPMVRPVDEKPAGTHRTRVLPDRSAGARYEEAVRWRRNPRTAHRPLHLPRCPAARRRGTPSSRGAGTRFRCGAAPRSG